MKRLLLLSSISLLISFTSAGQYATDFNAADCDGNPHHLFSELDAGKVIVIAWVMPCATCIADPLDAYVIVNSYSTSDPGRVFFYLVDDFADNTCQTLTTWAATYGMTDCPKFSDPAIDMFDYGSFGMPKIVVLGSSSHIVYFNKNNSTEGIGEAIDQALIGVNTVGISRSADAKIELTCFPNPANTIMNVRYNLKNAASVKIEVINLFGSVIQTTENEYKAYGRHELAFNTSNMGNGIYFVKITTDQVVDKMRFVVSH